MIRNISGFETGNIKELEMQINRYASAPKRPWSFFDTLLRYSKGAAEWGCENTGDIIICENDFSFTFKVNPDDPYEWKVTIKKLGTPDPT